MVQRWLGHARIETTAIYAGALGEEERNLARKTWSFMEFGPPEFADRFTGANQIAGEAARR